MALNLSSCLPLDLSDWLRPTDRQTDLLTDRQTDWPTDRPTYQQTYRPTDLQTDRPTYRPTDWLTDRQTYLPTDLQTDRPTDWQTDRPTDRPTDRQTDQVLKKHVNIWNIAGICALLLRNETSTASIPRCTVSRTNAWMLVDAGVNRISVGICSSPFLEFPTDSRLTRWAAHTHARTHTRTHTRTHVHTRTYTHAHTHARTHARISLSFRRSYLSFCGLSHTFSPRYKSSLVTRSLEGKLQATFSVVPLLLFRSKLIILCLLKTPCKITKRELVALGRAHTRALLPSVILGSWCRLDAWIQSRERRAHSDAAQGAGAERKKWFALN